MKDENLRSLDRGFPDPRGTFRAYAVIILGAVLQNQVGADYSHNTYVGWPQNLIVEQVAQGQAELFCRKTEFGAMTKTPTERMSRKGLRRRLERGCIAYQIK